MHWLGSISTKARISLHERNDLYNSYVDKLLETGKAYHCSCTPKKWKPCAKPPAPPASKPKYNGKCREMGLGPGPGRVVRFKTCRGTER